MIAPGWGGLAMTAFKLLLAAGMLLATVGKSDARQEKRDIFGLPKPCISSCHISEGYGILKWAALVSPAKLI